MTFATYMKKESIRRELAPHFFTKNLKTILGFMSDAERAILAAHVPTITFNSDVRDCANVKEHYQLSRNEIRTMIMMMA